MNLNYAIFRSQPIMTLVDLIAQQKRKTSL